MDNGSESDREHLLERLERLERAVARGQEGLDAYARGFAKLSAELDEVRALVASAPAPATAPPPPVVPAAPAPVPAPTPPPQAPPPPARRQAVEQPPAAPPPSRPSGRPRPPTAPRRTFGELARDWDLTGARGFAIAGGAVMALGIGFFFVLAANRGWIDERMRVALGAGASTLVFTAGLVLRARYGQYWSALAAVGAGIAGAYATLAAASVRYDLVPDELALPFAAAIAAVGIAVAVRWRSQVIAGIALLGAALAPGLQALDTDLTWESAAFATIVLAATATAAVPRAWHPLLVAISVVVGVQVEWLAVEAASPVDPGTVGVALAFMLILLGIAVGRQLVSRLTTEVDPLALRYALVAFSTTMILAFQLFDDRTERGVSLLAASAIWALAAGALATRRLPDLTLVVGTSALAAAAVGTADLLSDAALTLAWAGQALAFAALARRLGDARLQATGIVYLALAGVSVLVSNGRLDFLFDQGADQLAGVPPLAAVALAAAGSAVFTPSSYRERTESGLLTFLGDLRRALAAHRDGLRELLGFVGAGYGTLAAAFLFVSFDFEVGHIAASCLAAAVGALLLATAARIRSTASAVASYAWLSVVLVESFFDAAEFLDDATDASTGGWSVLAASAGLLLGAYAHRVLDPAGRGRDWLLGTAAAIAAVVATLGVGTLQPDGGVPAGIGLIVAALVYVALAAGVFRRTGFRNASTILWSLGLLLLVGGEALVVDDPTARGAVVVFTALGVGVLARPLQELRLWLAGSALGICTTAIILLVLVQPWLDDIGIGRVAALASGACTVALFGLAALVWGRERWRDLATVVWSVGVVALLVTERVVLDDWRTTATAVVLTGASLALAAQPLRELRLWNAGCVIVGATTVLVIGLLTPPSHLLFASETPADGLWVLVACLVAILVAGLSSTDRDIRIAIGAIAGGVALYAVSLGILEVAERVSGASIETDFERGQTAVSGLWALVGLVLLVGGLLRGSPALRYGGLALFGLSLAKIFLYDLSSLSSLARAFSFILVGGLLLAGGFFLQRLSDRLGPSYARGTTSPDS
jgi:uncharacterized membrane protein